jgi:membrane-associated phospholipid phosphatase
VQRTADADGGRGHVRPVDALTIAFMALLALISVIALRDVREWWPVLLVNAAAAFAIIATAMRQKRGRLLEALYQWYPAPFIFILFKEVYIIIQSLGRGDFDGVLITADRWMLGVDPTVWLERFSSPVLTELLQLAYASYYFIMLTLGIELYLRKDTQNFSFAVFVVAYGFFLSYLGYLAFPAVGPRFTLHSFQALEKDLPGLLLTNPIRELLNSAESIPGGIANALSFAQRDAFPSGHTQITLISIVLAYRYHLRARHILLIAGTLLIISTVYLRYHYFVDLLGGALFAWFTLWTAPTLYAWWIARTSGSGERAGFLNLS